MGNVLTAYARALRSLTRPDIFWHMLWPSLIAIALWVGVGIWAWSEVGQAALRLIEVWPLVGDWVASNDAAQLALGLGVHFLLVLLFIPLVFVTSAILVSLLALPLMLDRVAATDYQDLEQRRGGTIAGSIVNALWATCLFLVAVVLTLPLWLIPGLGLVLSVMLAAWLNQRCYRYDALMNHADAAEMRAVARARRGDMYLLGVGSGVLAYVPFLNLIVPAFTGLAFVHYLLEALRAARRGQI